MTVDEKTAKYVSEIDGARAYFCSATCKSEFEGHEKDYDKNSNRRISYSGIFVAWRNDGCNNYLYPL